MADPEWVQGLGVLLNPPHPAPWVQIISFSWGIQRNVGQIYQIETLFTNLNPLSKKSWIRSWIAYKGWNTCLVFNPYKPSVPFYGHRQTVQTQIRRHRTRRLIRVFTVSKESKNEKVHHTPLKFGNGLVQLIRMDRSTIGKCGLTNSWLMTLLVLCSLIARQASDSVTPRPLSKYFTGGPGPDVFGQALHGLTRRSL